MMSNICYPSLELETKTRATKPIKKPVSGQDVAIVRLVTSQLDIGAIAMSIASLGALAFYVRYRARGKLPGI
jgi:hypothetical protein